MSWHQCFRRLDLRHEKLRSFFPFLLLIVILQLFVVYNQLAEKEHEVTILTDCCSNHSWFDLSRRSKKRVKQVCDAAASTADEDPILNAWMRNRSRQCGGKFEAYATTFAIMRDVVITRSNAIGSRMGGEDLNEVKGQSESLEFFNLTKGFAQMNCGKSGTSRKYPKYKFTPDDNPLNSLVLSISALDRDAKRKSKMVNISAPTILVQRHEYCNLYHTITDWFNAFVMIALFKLDPNEVRILLIDAHPACPLDNSWPVLFNRVDRVSRLPPRAHFDTLVLSLWGYQSPLSTFQATSLPLSELFRDFMFTAHAMEKYRNKKLKCNQLVATLVLRRPYEAHPRSNERVSTPRRILNEQELVDIVRWKFVETGKLAELVVVQLDTLPLSEQLKLIARTDILIGMHGAGLTHALFLPRHAGLIEMQRTDSGGRHFLLIADWRSLAYEDLIIPDSDNYGLYSRISPYGLADAISRILVKLKCVPNQN